MLAFARGVEGERVSIQPGTLIREVEKITNETFPSDIEVHTHVPDTLDPIMGDATQIQQVLMNLCVNARDAMPEGGTLSIEATTLSLDENDARRTLDAEPGRYVCLRVADTGTGIPDDVVDKVFEPFFSTKPEGEGTGLGLSTAYSIVKSHDGFIDIDSSDAGTTFSVYLPVAETDVERPTASERTIQHSGGDAHVLVVDDEDFILETAAETLRDAGYRVSTASGGTDALDMAERAAIDVVMTDLRMPHMNGFALIRQLRARYPSLPIIAASGMADGRTDEALEAGAQAFLAKPFTAEKLHATLQDVLQSESA